jgi:DUF1680 family protein
MLADPYDVAPGSSTAETQAAIANARWNLRMLSLTGDAHYGDVLETALYNSISAALSQSGGFSCGHGVLMPADKTKSPYYESENCPPDVLSLFTSIGSYFYATSHDGVYVTLYNNSELNWHLQDGTGIRLVQTTNFPWDGDVKMTLYPAKPAQFALRLRWPSWAPALDLSVNGEKVSGAFEAGTFVTIGRTWQPGDVVSLSLSMPAVLRRANQRATELWGKAAVSRGPLVYSLQQADQGPTPVPDLFLRASGTGTVDVHRELMGGITLLRYPGYATEKSASQPLYTSWRDPFLQNRRAVGLTFAPYFVTGSRDSDSSETWVPVLRSLEPGSPPPAVPRTAAPVKKDDR